MTIQHLFRALAAIAFILFAAPMSNAADGPPSPSDPDVASARALIKAGKFNESLTVLRLLSSNHPGRTDILFLIGLAAIENSQRQDTTETDREALLDEAIASLHAILIDRPDLVRVRLELARAFFLKGEDSLSRDHFERVMASNPPSPVAANVQRFLGVIRVRRRWSMYLGATLLPDSNIGGSSDAEIIYINDLPFRRDADELTTSGVGVSIWTGGEYQYPLGDRLRLRVGGNVARQEYTGRKYDQTFLSGHAGPRWLVDKDTDISLLGSVRRRWVGTVPFYDDLGARVEAGRKLTRRVTVTGRASWHRRDHRTRDFLDGPVLDLSLIGAWVILPILRADAAVGYARERPESEVWRNATRWMRVGASVALPRGFTVGGSGELRWTGYEGNWFPFTRDGTPRDDRTRILRLSVHNRAFTVYGFSPQLAVINEVRDTNAQLYDYKRTRGELQFVRQF